MALTVVIAEDSLLMREGIKSVLALDDELEIVGVCGDYDSLIAAVNANEPDAVITDIRMPPTQTDEGIRAANHIRDTHPTIGVVVLSQYVEPRYALSLFETGTSGRAYLLKERVADRGELASAIRLVAEGRSVVDPRVVDALVEARTADKKSILRRLTEREMEVLAEMATGANNAAIGEALFISARSVEKHINAIFTKLELSQTDDIHRRVRAVLLYLGGRD
jgi:DNA-binding NarL/FixJ family response regulator